MSSLLFSDCKVYVGGYNLSGQLNQAALQYTAMMLDETTFGATTRINKGGLKAVTAAIEGLWDASSTSAPDPVLFAGVGTAQIPVSLVPQGATAGNTAFLFRAAQADYKPGAAIGELLGFSVELLGSGGLPGLVRGALLHAGSATGNISGGTAVQLGAVAAGKSLYAILHTFSGTGNFTVKIQSDDNSGFTSATDRITFTQVGTATPVASEWATVAGAITDDWFRITATNPNTRDFAVTLGIR